MVVIAVLAGAYLWVRDSSLVAVKRVSVVGVTGPEAGRIRHALMIAARNMTTLDVRMNQLRTAVAPYAVVRSLHVSTQFPHGMRIQVVEEIPVATISVGGRAVAVAADGTLLENHPGTGQLPVIPMSVEPGGTTITDPTTLRVIAMLAAAPWQLIPHVSQASMDSAHGLVAQLRNGPAIYFGDPTRLAAKWKAVVEMLSTPSAAGAPYIDVTVPERPAAGVTGTSTSGAAGASTPGATGTSLGTGTGTPGATETSTPGLNTGTSTAGATTVPTPTTDSTVAATPETSGTQGFSTSATTSSGGGG